MNASVSAWRDLGSRVRIASTMGSSDTVSSFWPVLPVFFDGARLAGSTLAAGLAEALRLVLMGTEVPMKEGPRSSRGPGDTVQYGLFADTIGREAALAASSRGRRSRPRSTGQAVGREEPKRFMSGSCRLGAGVLSKRSVSAGRFRCGR